MTSVIVPPERTIENSERQGVFISYSQHRPSTSGDFSGGSALATESKSEIAFSVPRLRHAETPRASQRHDKDRLLDPVCFAAPAICPKPFLTRSELDRRVSEGVAKPPLHRGGVLACLMLRPCRRTHASVREFS